MKRKFLSSHSSCTCFIETFLKLSVCNSILGFVWRCFRSTRIICSTARKDRACASICWLVWVPVSFSCRFLFICILHFCAPYFFLFIVISIGCLVVIPKSALSHPSLACYCVWRVQVCWARLGLWAQLARGGRSARSTRIQVAPIKEIATGFEIR